MFKSNRNRTSGHREYKNVRLKDKQYKGKQYIEYREVRLPDDKRRTKYPGLKPINIAHLLNHLKGVPEMSDIKAVKSAKAKPGTCILYASSGAPRGLPYHIMYQPADESSAKPLKFRLDLALYDIYKQNPNSSSMDHQEILKEIHKYIKQQLSEDKQDNEYEDVRLEDKQYQSEVTQDQYIEYVEVDLPDNKRRTEYPGLKPVNIAHLLNNLKGVPEMSDIIAVKSAKATPGTCILYASSAEHRRFPLYIMYQPASGISAKPLKFRLDLALYDIYKQNPNSSSMEQQEILKEIHKNIKQQLAEYKQHTKKLDEPDEEPPSDHSPKM